MSASSSPEKRAWKTPKKTIRRHLDGKRFEELRKDPEEHVLDCVQRVTSSGVLIEPKSLTYSLLTLPQDDIDKCLLMQYGLARQKGRNVWSMK